MKRITLLLLYLFLLAYAPVGAKQPTAKNFRATDSINSGYVFQLHGQTRRYNMLMQQTSDGGLQINWTIFSYQKWLKGSYCISPKGICCGTELSFKQPQNGNKEQLKDKETFGVISITAFNRLKQTDSFVYNSTTYRLKEKQDLTIGDKTLEAFHVIADIDYTEMWIWDNDRLPLILQLEKNPLGIDFYLDKIQF